MSGLSWLCLYIFLLTFWGRTGGKDRPGGVGGNEGRLLLSSTCPRRYTVHLEDADDIEITVVNRKSSVCSGKGKGTGSVPPTDDLMPIMDIYESGGGYYVNITWTPNIQDGRYPRRFYLSLIARWLEGSQRMTSQACVVLKLSRRRANKTQKPATFFYDCLRLTPEPFTYLYVKIWSLPGRLGQGLCTRHRRSVPYNNNNNCHGSASGIQCSQETVYPLSLDLHKSSICLCRGGDVRANLTILPNGSVQVALGSLPQFALDIQAVVIRENDDQTVYDHWLDPTTELNETRVFSTSKRVGVGNYSLEVYINCPEKPDFDFRKECPLETKRGASFFNLLEVTNPEASSDYHRNVIIGVLAAVVTTVLVTVVVYIKCRRTGKYSNNSSRGSHTVENNSSRGSHTVENTRTTLFRTGDYCRGNVTGGSRHNSPGSIETIELTRLLKTSNVESHYKMDAEPVGTNEEITCLNVDEEIRMPNYGELLISNDGEMSKSTCGGRKVMLLCHPDNKALENVINDVCELMRAFEIHLVKGNGSDNWRDFAESVGVDIHDVVIIMSPGLVSLCHLYPYLDRSQRARDMFSTLLTERFKEYIPCVALDVLRTIVQRKSNKVAIHIVSPGYNSSAFEDLRELFLKDHNFISRSDQQYYYKLGTMHRDHSEMSIDLNSDDIARLIHSMCDSEPPLTLHTISDAVRKFVITEKGVSFKSHLQTLYAHLVAKT